MNKYLLFAILFSVLTFLACGGDDDDNVEEETFDYSVTIMSPDATNKNVRDSIHIHVNFDEADNKTIHNVEVKITDEDEKEIYSFKEHVHDETGHYEVHADVLLDVAPSTLLTMTASVKPHDSDEHDEEDQHEHGEEHTDMVTQTLQFEVN